MSGVCPHSSLGTSSREGNKWHFLNGSFLRCTVIRQHLWKLFGDVTRNRHLDNNQFRWESFQSRLNGPVLPIEMWLNRNQILIRFITNPRRYRQFQFLCLSLQNSLAACLSRTETILALLLGPIKLERGPVLDKLYAKLSSVLTAVCKMIESGNQ